MGTIKIHTHNRESAESLLKEITLDDTFWNYGVNYKVVDDAFAGADLDTNEHYFNLPEFKWSPNIQSRTCIRVEAPTQKVRDAVFSKFGKKSGGLNYIHHELEPNPANEYEYTYEYKVEPK